MEACVAQLRTFCGVATNKPLNAPSRTGKPEPGMPAKALKWFIN
jgi:hypothetical protein